MAIITTLLVIMALKLSASVTLPIGFALFLIALLWPIYRWSCERMRSGLAALLALASLLLVVGLILGGIWYSADVIAEKAPRYAEKAAQMQASIGSTFEKHNLPVSKADLSQVESFGRGAMSVGRGVFGFLGGAVLATAFFVLGLLEVRPYKRRLLKVMPERGRNWRDVADRIAQSFQRYIVVRTGIGLLQGIAIALAALLMGLDLAFVWGLTSFLLNYIPTLGSIVAILPPTLFALVQFGSIGMAALALLVFGGLQLIMGNYLDPLVQGHYLKLSPFVVLASVVFWGWVWGIAGAFIGVPITILVVLVCREFPSTRWIAIMLAGADKDETAKSRRRRRHRLPAMSHQ